MGKRSKKHGSRSPNYKYKSDSYKKHKSPNREPAQTTDQFDVFEQYKYELNKVLKGKDINVKDTDDFWSFLNKYQVMYKRSQNVNKDQSC